MATLLRRSRLLLSLDRPMPLTVIRAPRGAGKSVLVDSWLASPGAAAEVVVVPEIPHDCPEDQLWRRVAAALVAASPGQGESAPEQSAPEESAEDPFAAVEAVLGRAPGDLVLVLDHPDRADGGSVLDRLLRLLRHHDRLRLVVCTRSQTLFGDYSAVDVDFQIIEREDLRFTRAETAQWLSQSGADVPDLIASAVHQHLGGIPRLLQEIAPITPLLAQVDYPRALERIDAAVLDLVRREVFGPGVPDAVGAIVVSCGLLGAVCATAVSAVLGVTTPEADLAAVDDVGLLQQRRVDGACMVTFVPALRVAVKAIVADGLAEPINAQLSTIGQWLCGRGDFAGALRCGMTANDWDLAWPVLRGNWSELVAVDVDLVRDALLRVPEGMARQYPPVSLSRSVFTGVDTGQVARMFAPDGGPFVAADGSPLPFADVLSLGTVQMVHMRLRGEFGPAAALAHRLIAYVDGQSADELRCAPQHLRMMRLQWGISLQLAGEVARSDEQFRRTASEADSVEDGLVLRNAIGAQALNNALIGEVHRAADLVRLDAGLAEIPGVLGRRARAGGRIARVLVAAQQMDFDGAQRELAALGSLADAEEYWAPLAFAHCTVEMALGRPEVAVALLERTVKEHSGLMPEGSLAHRLMQMAAVNLFVNTGRGNEALAIVSGAMRSHPALRVLRARIHLLSGDPAAASAEVQGLAWNSASRPGTAIHALLVAAAAQCELGDADAARLALERASTLAAVAGPVGLLHTMPHRYRERLVAAGAVGDELRESWREHAHLRFFPDELELITLTPRESKVVELLADGVSPSGLAEALFVSPNTIKTQLRSVYRKLGVNSKDDAVRAARKLCLI